jgi:hypothetical protein
VSGRDKWDPDKTKAAVTAKEKEVGSFKASRFFRVPQRTLKQYVKFERNSANRIERKLGRKFVLPRSLEEGLVEDFLNMENVSLAGL